MKLASRRLSSLRLVAAPFVVLALVFVCGCGSRAQAPSTPSAGAQLYTELDDYIARPEPVYKWSKVSQQKIGTNMVTTLDVTSQTWQGIVWKQRTEIAVPDRNDFPGTALIYLSTADSAMESMLMQSLAGQVHATIIHVMGMPNQPLWGMREDDLIAHTFSKFLETGDATWPLLLPMTKGAIKAMDAVQEYSQQQGKPLDKFVVTGASKRGWTTWLVGAADRKHRIIGIIPIVYDNLNLAAQMPHQLESWGKYSPMIEDYTRRGIQKQMATEKGRELARLVDPYTYRRRLTMPKLIVNGTNDPYWTLDALNLYWNDLPEPKSVYYAPNAGHSMEGEFAEVLSTMGAWFRLVAGEKPVPTIEMETPVGDSLNVKAPGAKVVRFWHAQSDSKDFRNSHWDAATVEVGADGAAKYSLTPPAGKFLAVTAQAEYPADGSMSLRLNTPVVIRGGK